MKNIKALFRNMIVLAIITWLIFAFYEWDFYPGDWSDDSRGAWALVTGSIGFFVALGTTLNSDD